MTLYFPLEEVSKQKEKYRGKYSWSVSALALSRYPTVEKQFSPIIFQSPHLQDLPPQMLLWIMSFWKKKSVLKLIKHTEKPHHCNPPQNKAADSQWSWQLSLTLLPSWERDRNWRGTQSNLQVSTASDPDAEWRPDALFPFTGYGSSLVSGTTWSSQSHTGAQCLTTQIPSAHVTSTTIYISTHNQYSYFWRCIGSESQDRNEVAIIKLHLLAFEIHCLLLLWVSRLGFFSSPFKCYK